VLQVCLTQLVCVLEPSPQHCLEELQQLLPCLAATAYNGFISRCGRLWADAPQVDSPR